MEQNTPINLVNAEGKVTPHKFVRHEPRTVEIVQDLADGNIRRIPVTGAAVIYACTETGLERQWGLL